MRLQAQLYSKKQTEKEPVAVFLQQKFLLALRLLPEAAEEEIVPILLESLRPSIKRVIRAASPRTIAELFNRATEAEADEAEEHPRRETKKEELKTKLPETTQIKSQLGFTASAQNLPRCRFCPERHFHKDCPTLANLRKNDLQENWRQPPTNTDHARPSTSSNPQ